MKYYSTEPMKLSLTSHGKTFSAELNWDSTFNEILQALVGLGVAATYSHVGILETMQNFAEEELEALRPLQEEKLAWNPDYTNKEE